jgi:hypothetical protein
MLDLDMTAAPKMRDLAHRLLAYEADAGDGPEPTGSATLRVTLRVYEKLRQSLVEFVGLAGFHSLASRALTLARPDDPGLGAVQIAADGSLLGMGPRLEESQGEIETEIDMDKNLAGAVGTLLIVRLLELLRIFLGEALTLSLLRNAWPGEVFDDGNAVHGREA